MTLRKKLESVIGTMQEGQLTVPAHYTTADMVRGAASFAATVQELVDERNKFKERCEWLACKLQVANETAERVSVEHYEACQGLACERDYWRGQALGLLNDGAEIRTTINGMINFARMAHDSLHRMAAREAQLPPVHLTEQEQVQPNGRTHDEHGMPVIKGAPPVEIDLQGTKELAAKLAAAMSN